MALVTQLLSGRYMLRTEFATSIWDTFKEVTGVACRLAEWVVYEDMYGNVTFYWDCIKTEHLEA